MDVASQRFVKCIFLKHKKGADLQPLFYSIFILCALFFML